MKKERERNLGDYGQMPGKNRIQLRAFRQGVESKVFTKLIFPVSAALGLQRGGTPLVGLCLQRTLSAEEACVPVGVPRREALFIRPKSISLTPSRTRIRRLSVTA